MCTEESNLKISLALYIHLEFSSLIRANSYDFWNTKGRSDHILQEVFKNKVIYKKTVSK